MVAALLVTEFRVPLGRLVSAFLVRGWFLIQGVGFRMDDGQIAYFWTSYHQDVLDALSERCVSIASEPQPATQLWRLMSRQSLSPDPPICYP
jgi:hypothetical protein